MADGFSSACFPIHLHLLSDVTLYFLGDKAATDHLKEMCSISQSGYTTLHALLSKLSVAQTNLLPEAAMITRAAAREVAFFWQGLPWRRRDRLVG